MDLEPITQPELMPPLTPEVPVLPLDVSDSVVDNGSRPRVGVGTRAVLAATAAVGLGLGALSQQPAAAEIPGVTVTQNCTGDVATIHINTTRTTEVKGTLTAAKNDSSVSISPSSFTIEASPDGNETSSQVTGAEDTRLTVHVDGEADTASVIIDCIPDATTTIKKVIPTSTSTTTLGKTGSTSSTTGMIRPAPSPNKGHTQHKPVKSGGGRSLTGSHGGSVSVSTTMPDYVQPVIQATRSTEGELAHTGSSRNKKAALFGGVALGSGMMLVGQANALKIRRLDTQN